MRIVILTAGGAGMFCGSCMHDNTLARALIAAGHDCQLVPCYTPIRVDEENRSQTRVFLGGVNLYLDYKWRWWGQMPPSLRRMLDRPSVLQWLSKFQSRSNAAELGELTIATLSGEHGPLRAEIPPLVDYITNDVRPDVVIYSNALMAGTLPSLRATFDGPIVCMLQGDDVFLDGLPAEFQAKAVAETAKLARQFDGLLTHTCFYADHMSRYLGVDRNLFRQIPLGIDTSEYANVSERAGDDDVTIGYFARMAPEKGLHYLVDAYLTMQDKNRSRLRIGGYAHPKDRAYLDKLTQKLVGTRADAPEHPETLDEKIAFYESVDLVSVPTEFLEPKGLSILEAMACGRPVVQPAHGAFPEIIAATGGGVLVEPRNSESLATALQDLVSDHDKRLALGRAGRIAVNEHYGMAAMATKTIEVLQEFTGRRDA